MNPLEALNDHLRTLSPDMSVKDAANSCIKHTKTQLGSTSAQYLEESKLESLNGSFVKFCGLIISESQEDHYFLPLKLNKDGDWSNVGLFKDPDNLDADSEELAFSFESLMPRKSLKVASIPGWSAWSKANFGDQNLESIDVIVYDEHDMEACRVGSVYEFYGVFQYVEGIPELHLVKLCAPENGIGYISPNAELEATSTRQSLLSYLSEFFGSNQTAAKLFLANQVSLIAERKSGLLNSLLIGHLPINFVFSKDAADAKATPIQNLVELLRPASTYLPIDATSLGNEQFSPSIDAATGTLSRGALQLAPGTHLLIDETCLEQGQLSELATANIKAVMELLDHQHVSYNFGYQSVDITCDYPLIGVSKGKSIFKHYWSVELNEIGNSDEMCEKKVASWRHFLEQAKHIKVRIPSEVSERLELDYVSRRQEQSAKFDENHFSNVLNLAKLITKTHVVSEMTWEHWQEALEIFHAVHG